MAYSLAHDPRYTDLMTVKSSLTGKTINRFTHLDQSTEDLLNKVKMERLLGQKTASCFQRCVGMDAFNAVFSTTFEIDEAHGTSYHENFKKFLTMVQDNDLTVDGAMTDPKGDRSKAPHLQADPDMYLHVVERFAGYHRQSYGGCKVGVGDVVIGAAVLATEYNGVEKASAVKDKLIEMTHLNETLYSCGIACSCEGCPTKAGNYQIDLLLANVCKQNITRFPYEMVRLAEDIAGIV